MMKKLGFVLVLMVAVASLLMAGCGGGGEEEGTPTPTEGPGATGTPTVTETPEATPTRSPGETPAPGEIEPVSFQGMLPLLPDPPSGWEADDPDGFTGNFGEWRWSQVDKDYTNQATDEYVYVAIHDSAFYQGFSWMAAWQYQLEYESTEGYARSSTVAGYPAWEAYDQPDSYTLMVLVADRFLVMITSETEASLNQFADLIDYGGIAALE